MAIDCVAMTGILIACSVSDLSEYKIRNPIILAGWIAGLAFRYFREGILSAGLGVVCIAAVIAAAWPLFLLRWIGAGDIKLLSVVAGFYGLRFLGKVIVLLLFFAGIVSLAHLLKKRLFLRRFRYFIQYVMYGRKGIYYDAQRDGREWVIPMAPLLAAAYFFIRIQETGIWKG